MLEDFCPASALHAARDSILSKFRRPPIIRHPWAGPAVRMAANGNNRTNLSGKAFVYQAERLSRPKRFRLAISVGSRKMKEVEAVTIRLVR